jgi:YidC/Oxa1 family membrane protein insertase
MGVILRFIGRILEFFIGLTGNNYVFALALFALVIQILLLPFAIKQQKNSIKQARLAPKLMAIRKKYAGRDDKVTKQKIQQETMELYQQEGFNPAGGCLPLLIQMPIILVLYQVIIKPLSYVVGLSSDAITAIGEKLVSLGAYSAEGFDVTKISQIEIVSKMQTLGVEKFSSIEELSGKTLPNLQMGPFDLGQTPQAAIKTAEGWQWSWLILIPIVTLGMMLLTQWVTRKLTYQAPDAVEQQKTPAMRIMNLAMPLFSAYIAFIWPAAIGIYWFIRNVYQLGQQFLIAKIMPLPEFTEEDYKEAEREMRGKTQQKKVEKSENAGSQKSLFHMDDDDYVPPVEDESSKKSKAVDAEKKSAIDAAPLKDESKNDAAKPNGEEKNDGQE